LNNTYDSNEMKGFSYLKYGTQIFPDLHGFVGVQNFGSSRAGGVQGYSLTLNLDNMSVSSVFISVRFEKG
jgi:hypothetical protein